ncbi:hypothetical protein, partial [Facilibium subflavum]|uniref:hypothetical protein n=1 Tax=Facilibium subflavum TaxID=2219058 RepID=UPI0013C35310
MNLAEQNLQDIQKEISTIIEKLTALNTSKCIAYSTNKVETAQELSNKLSDLYTAFRHQEKVLTDTFKSEIKSQLDALGKRYFFKEYRATNVMYRNGTRID